MPYVVQGFVIDPDTGKQVRKSGEVDLMAETLDDAQEKALMLRAQGLATKVIDPLGDPVLDEDLIPRVE